jgi:RNA polymerase subunit RPABC4/transcription elongation factor Spt4
MDLVVETVNTCPFCGDALELVEGASHVWFGCRRCMRYVKREKREMVRRFVNYREKKFNWSGMISELYQLYTRL